MPLRVAPLHRTPYRRQTDSFCCECNAHRWIARIIKTWSTSCRRGLPDVPVRLPCRDVDLRTLDSGESEACTSAPNIRLAR
jgi:hypothetical protein